MMMTGGLSATVARLLTISAVTSNPPASAAEPVVSHLSCAECLQARSVAEIGFARGAFAEAGGGGRAEPGPPNDGGGRQAVDAGPRMADRGGPGPIGRKPVGGGGALGA